MLSLTILLLFAPIPEPETMQARPTMSEERAIQLIDSFMEIPQRERDKWIFWLRLYSNFKGVDEPRVLEVVEEAHCEIIKTMTGSQEPCPQSLLSR